LHKNFARILIHSRGEVTRLYVSVSNILILIRYPSFSE